MVFRPYTSRVESVFGSFGGKRNAQQIEIRHHCSAAFVFEQSRRSSSRSHNTSGERQQHDREVRRPTRPNAQRRAGENTKERTLSFFRIPPSMVADPGGANRISG